MEPQEVEKLVNDIRAGKVSPEDAVSQVETPAKHISQIPIDNLGVDILDCGFKSLNDNLVFKRDRAELIILGARPSMGKSAFMFQMASYIAQHSNVLIYSLEMDTESIKARMLAAMSRVNLQRIYMRQVLPEILQESNVKLNKLNLYIDDRSGLDVRTIRSTANSQHEKTPISLVVVDYLQLIKSKDRNTRNEEIGEITGELKALAKDIKAPVLVASQLNRECERRGKLVGDYKPILSDLRDSGNIEQDADSILFLNREGVITGQDKEQTDIGIAKARNGATGWFRFKFIPPSVQFEDLARELKMNPPKGPRAIAPRIITKDDYADTL